MNVKKRGGKIKAKPNPRPKGAPKKPAGPMRGKSKKMPC